MPTCTFFFSRHSGAGSPPAKPTEFIAKKLLPMISDALNEGRRLHIIHDLVPQIGLPEDVLLDYDKYEAKNAFRNRVKSTATDMKERAKTRLSSLDLGGSDAWESPPPEIKLIMEVNSKTPRTVMNHLGFYPMEAVFEYMRMRYHDVKAMEKGSSQDISGAITELVKSADALTSATLLKDTELVKQVALLGEDAIILRNLNHIYLAHFHEHEIRINEENRSIGLYDYYVSKGIDLDGEIDDVELTPREASINRSALGLMEKDLQRRDALLDLIFIGVMNREGLWSSDSGVDEGLRKTMGIYTDLMAESRQKSI